MRAQVPAGGGEPAKVPAGPRQADAESEPAGAHLPLQGAPAAAHAGAPHCIANEPAPVSLVGMVSVEIRLGGTFQNQAGGYHAMGRLMVSLVPGNVGNPQNDKRRTL